MLTAADLKKAFDDYADKLLIPIGFKKYGIHYYKKADGQFYAIIKDTSRGYFMDYYLVYSHEGADNVKKTKIPGTDISLKLLNEMTS